MGWSNSVRVRFGQHFATSTRIRYGRTYFGFISRVHGQFPCTFEQPRLALQLILCSTQCFAALFPPIAPPPQMLCYLYYHYYILHNMDHGSSHASLD